MHPQDYESQRRYSEISLREVTLWYTDFQVKCVYTEYIIQDGSHENNSPLYISMIFCMRCSLSYSLIDKRWRGGEKIKSSMVWWCRRWLRNRGCNWNVKMMIMMMMIVIFDRVHQKTIKALTYRGISHSYKWANCHMTKTLLQRQKLSAFIINPINNWSRMKQQLSC